MATQSELSALSQNLTTIEGITRVCESLALAHIEVGEAFVWRFQKSDWERARMDVLHRVHSAQAQLYALRQGSYSPELILRTSRLHAIARSCKRCLSENLSRKANGHGFQCVLKHEDENSTRSWKYVLNKKGDVLER